MPLIFAKLGAFALTWLGPLWAALGPHVPAWASLKAGLRILAAVALLALGAMASWTLYAWDEPRRLRKAQQEALERAALADRVKAQDEAIRAALMTLAARARALNASEEYITDLDKQLEALRAQSKDPAAPVFDADDPWLQRRPGAAKRVDRRP